MSGEINDQILLAYLRDKYNLQNKEITLESSLLYNLEMRGDDIDEFFADLIDHFKIEVKRLNLSRFYVGDEPFDMLSPIVRLFSGKNANAMPSLKISDILNFLETGFLE